MCRSRVAAAAVLSLLAACGAGPAVPEAADADPEPSETASASPLVGTRADVSGLRWLEPTTAPDLAGDGLTLLRWWTVQCPFCRASLPDLGDLHARFAPRGLTVVGVFHPKSPRAPADDAIVAYARDLGFAGPIAADDRWRVLEDLRRRGALDAATSISVLVDGGGVVRWVHAGPRLHRSDDPRYAEADRSFHELEQLLAERLR